MKRLLTFISLLFFLGVSAQVEKDVPSRPNPPKLVNDFVGVLTSEQREALERKLYTYDDTTSTQIAIVIVDDLKGYEPVDYAVALGRKWGVGGSQFSNGLIILVSTGGKDGQRKVFIAPGYGLEGAIPDVTAKAIVDNDLIPNLKNGDFYRAFDAATDDIIKAAAGEYKAPAGYGKKKGKGKGFGIGFIIFIIILISIFGGRRGGGGGMISRRGYGGLGTGWLIGSMLGGSGSGGGWSGGGGSSGGGGFGGFGGGSFGGGGAGGSW